MRVRDGPPELSRLDAELLLEIGCNFVVEAGRKKTQIARDQIESRLPVIHRYDAVIDRVEYTRRFARPITEKPLRRLRSNIDLNRCCSKRRRQRGFCEEYCSKQADEPKSHYRSYDTAFSSGSIPRRRCPCRAEVEAGSK